MILVDGSRENGATAGRGRPRRTTAVWGREIAERRLQGRIEVRK